MAVSAWRCCSAGFKLPSSVAACSSVEREAVDRPPSRINRAVCVRRPFRNRHRPISAPAVVNHNTMRPKVELPGNETAMAMIGSAKIVNRGATVENELISCAGATGRLSMWTAQADAAAIRPKPISSSGGKGAVNPPANRRETKNIATSAMEADSVAAIQWRNAAEKLDGCSARDSQETPATSMLNSHRKGGAESIVRVFEVPPVVAKTLYATAAAPMPAASANSAARCVLSQVNSFSFRPKCPPAAVLR